MTVITFAAAGLLVLVVLTQVPSGEGFQCFQCNSTSHAQCLEQFDHTYSSLKPSQCAVADAKYCIKVTGAWGGVVGTYRFCSSRDMGNQCQYFGFEDHDRRYRACVRTCNSESCNSAERSAVTMVTTLVTLLTSWLLKL